MHDEIPNKLSRRDFLGLLGVGAASVALAGCAGQLGLSDEEPPSGQNPRFVAFADSLAELETPTTLTFLWITDVHYGSTSGERFLRVPAYVDVVHELSAIVNPAALIVDGDIVDGKDTLEVHHEDVATIVAKLQESPVPVLATRGNHDDNSFFAENVAQTNNRADVVDTDWLAEHLIGPLIDDQCVPNSSQAKGCTYYYRDFPEARIRVVALDSSDVPYTADASGTRDYRSLIEFGVGADQMAWLADEALRFDEPGWAVVILSHVNLDDNRPYGLRAWGEVPVFHNDTSVMELLNAFKSNGAGRLVSDDKDFELDLSYDFSGNPSNELICCINGHTHRDQCNFQDGILSITMRGFTANRHARVSALVIDRDKGLVHLRACDSVRCVVPDWDLGYRDGSGIPEIFNFYRRGTFITSDGTQLMTEHMLFGDEEPPQIEHVASWTDLAIAVANG